MLLTLRFLARVILNFIYFALLPFIILASIVVIWVPIYSIAGIVLVIVKPFEIIWNALPWTKRNLNFSKQITTELPEYLDLYLYLILESPKEKIRHVTNGIVKKRKRYKRDETKKEADHQSIEVIESRKAERGIGNDTKDIEKKEVANNELDITKQKESAHSEVQIPSPKKSKNVQLTDTQISEIDSHTQNVDWAELNRYRHDIGKVGELIVLAYEKNELAEFDLDTEIEHVSETKGDGLGYDIRSVDLHGNPAYIEVKATTGGKNTNFRMSNNERKAMMEYGDQYWLYRVYNLDLDKKYGLVYPVRGREEIEKQFEFRAVNFRLKSR